MATDLWGALLGATLDLSAVRRGPPPPLLLWSAILAGPVAWTSDLGLSYVLVQWSCSNHTSGVLHVISGASFAMACAGGVLSWALLRATTSAAEYGGSSPNRPRFMAALGVACCALFALAIVAFAIPRWLLDACQ